MNDVAQWYNAGPSIDEARIRTCSVNEYLSEKLSWRSIFFNDLNVAIDLSI